MEVVLEARCKQTTVQVKWYYTGKWYVVRESQTPSYCVVSQDVEGDLRDEGTKDKDEDKDEGGGVVGDVKVRWLSEQQQQPVIGVDIVKLYREVDIYTATDGHSLNSLFRTARRKVDDVINSRTLKPYGAA